MVRGADLSALLSVWAIRGNARPLVNVVTRWEEGGGRVVVHSVKQIQDALLSDFGLNSHPLGFRGSTFCPSDARGIYT